MVVLITSIVVFWVVVSILIVWFWGPRSQQDKVLEEKNKAREWQEKYLDAIKKADIANQKLYNIEQLYKRQSFQIATMSKQIKGLQGDLDTVNGYLKENNTNTVVAMDRIRNAATMFKDVLYDLTEVNVDGNSENTVNAESTDD